MRTPTTDPRSLLNVQSQSSDLSLQKTVPSFQSAQTRVTLGNSLLWQNLLDYSIVRQALDDSIHVCFNRWLRICPASKPCVTQFFQKRHRRRNRVLISGTFHVRSHTLYHSPCLCPESYAFSLVALLHHPTTRRHSQTEITGK